MKTSRIIAALVTLCATASYAAVTIEARSDYQNSTFNDDAGKKGYSTTQVNRMRLKADHKVNEEVSVASRFNFLTTGSNTGADKSGVTSNIVDYASINYMPMPGLTISMGKLRAIGGGMENQYEGYDLYMTSALSNYSVLPDAGGVGVTYSMGDHQFDLQMTNDNSVSNAAGTPAATRNLAGAGYYGKFMDSKFQVIATHHTQKYHNQYNGTAVAEDKTVATSVLGLKYDAGMVLVDLDYGMTVDEATVLNKKNTYSGAVLNVAVPVDTWKFIVKAESTTVKLSDEKALTYMNTGVAVEKSLGPMSNFHIAYNMLSRKNENASAATSDFAGNSIGVDKTYKESQLFAGFTVIADIMK